MKIMKKIAVAVFAGAMVFGFASCAGGDDPEGAIKGSGKNYSIDYTNEGTEVYRAYRDTAFKHAGACVQIDFLNVTEETKRAGVMGLIFDLVEKDGKKSFNVIGLRTADANGALEYYVSRFENVTDIRAQNFGAPEDKYKGNGATEDKIVNTWGKAQGNFDSTDKTVTVYPYAILKQNGEKWQYECYLLKNKIKSLDSDGNPINEDGQKVELDSKKAVIIETSYTELTQTNFAVYANIYAKSDKKDAERCGTLQGKWTYRGDYKEVGVDED